MKYTNTELQKVVKNYGLAHRILLIVFLIAVSPLVWAFSRTIGEYHKPEPLAFDAHHLVGFTNIPCEFTVTEMPERLNSSDYYMVKVGADAIAMKNGGKLRDTIEKRGSATVLGFQRKFDPDDKQDAAIMQAVQVYYRTHGIYTPEESERISQFYLDRTTGFWGRLFGEHLVPLILGSVLLATVLWFALSPPISFPNRNLFPACGSVRYTPRQIDELASHPDTEFDTHYRFFLTPDALIALDCGIAAIAYDDIVKVRNIRSCLYVKTRNHRWIMLSNNCPVTAFQKCVQNRCTNAEWDA